MPHVTSSHMTRSRWKGRKAVKKASRFLRPEQFAALDDKNHRNIQGSAKEWSLGCVKRAPAARGSQDAGITQPREPFFIIMKNFFYLHHDMYNITVHKYLTNFFSQTKYLD